MWVCAAPGVERGGLLALECDTHPPVEGVASSRSIHARQASPQLLQDHQRTPPLILATCFGKDRHNKLLQNYANL